MIGNLLEASSLIASAYGLKKAIDYHETELESSKTRHQEIINDAKKKHNDTMMNTKKTYLLELFYSLDQHFLQLNADLISSGKESERDMFDQCSQNSQTIILAASVMFSALATVISQGYLPYNKDMNPLYPVNNVTLSINHNSWNGYVENGKGLDMDSIYISYALFCGLSFGSLFLSVVISSEIIQVASKFMYKRAVSTSSLLRDALNDTKEMMDTLMATDTEQEDKAERKRLLVSEMDPIAVEEEFNNHEKKVRKYLDQRNSLNMKLANNWKAPNPSEGSPVEMPATEPPPPAAAATTTTTGQQIKKNEGESFEEFWKANCSKWAILALILFYAGTLALLVAILIFVWAQFSITYKQRSAAYIAIVLIALSIAGGMVLVIWLDNACCGTNQIQEDPDSSNHGGRHTGSSVANGDEEEKEGGRNFSFNSPPVGMQPALQGDSVEYADFLLRQKSYPIIYDNNPLARTSKSAEDIDLEEFKDNSTLL
eukprot:gene26457-35116_t